MAYTEEQLKQYQKERRIVAYPPPQDMPLIKGYANKNDLSIGKAIIELANKALKELPLTVREQLRHLAPE